MSKGTVVDSLGMGKYTLTQKYNVARATAEIAALDTEFASIASRLNTVAADIVDAQQQVVFAEERLNAAIINQDSDDIKKELVAGVLAAKRALQNQIDLQEWLRLRRTAIEHRQSWISEHIPVDETITVWCADFNELLSGDVGLVEVGREVSTGPIIIPGGTLGDEAGWSAANDGELTPLEFQGYAAAFYNLAMLPGMTKFRPRYRTGTLTSKSGDTGSVTLDSFSSGSYPDSINLNQTPTLSSVPIRYMHCNGEAFIVGDQVLVHFIGSDWSTPEIVGFVSNPRPCAPINRIAFYNDYTELGYVFDASTGTLLTPTPVTTSVMLGFGTVVREDQIRSTPEMFEELHFHADPAFEDKPLWVNGWTPYKKITYQNRYVSATTQAGIYILTETWAEHETIDELDLATLTYSRVSDTSTDFITLDVFGEDKYTGPFMLTSERIEIETPAGMAGTLYQVTRADYSDLTSSSASGGPLGIAATDYNVMHRPSIEDPPGVISGETTYPIFVRSLFRKGIGFILTSGPTGSFPDPVYRSRVDFYVGELQAGGDEANAYDYNFTLSGTYEGPDIPGNTRVFFME